MSWCITQCNMLLFWVKTIVKVVQSLTSPSEEEEEEEEEEGEGGGGGENNMGKSITKDQTWSHQMAKTFLFLENT